MKTLLIGFLIFSMLLPSILAADANIYKAQDFTKHPEQLAVVQERDLIRIDWEGKEHQIHVRKIYYPEKQKVDLTAFIEGSEVPFYMTITPKTSLQLDFNRDDVYDLRVSIFNILEEGGKKFVALKLEKLEQEAVPVTTEAIIKKTDNDLYQYVVKNKTYLIIGLVLSSLIVIITFKKFKK